MINVYLDDVRPCPKGFVLARNAMECIELLRSCEVNVLSLDFDLGWDEPTGLEVARFIATENRYPGMIYLHTSSPAGRLQMYQTLYLRKPDHVSLYNHPMPEELLGKLAAGK